MSKKAKEQQDKTRSFVAWVEGGPVIVEVSENQDSYSGAIWMHEDIGDLQPYDMREMASALNKAADYAEALNA